MDGMSIRKGRVDDLAALQALLAGFDMGSQDLSPEDFFISEIDGGLVGAVLLQRVAGEVYLRAMAVDPAWQGQGIGRQLVQSFGRDLDSVKLVSRGSVAPFYHKLGYRTTSWEDIEPGMRIECDQCPDLEGCQPVPMICKRKGQ
jgi:N-acetylglutamate synthase-like GNAT family acetyltransferase